MSKSKFVGVAYWTVATSRPDWLGRAAAVLAVLEPSQLATVKFDCLPAGEQMMVTFGDSQADQYQMLVNNGQGRGVVRASSSAGQFVLCLIALRKALGDMTVVTDAQVSVSTIPRQSDPLFAEDWLRCLPVAQELGLVCGEAFMARHKAVLTNVF